MEYSSSYVMYMDDKVVYNSRFNGCCLGYQCSLFKLDINHNGGLGISRRLVLDQPNHRFQLPTLYPLIQCSEFRDDTDY